MEGRQRPNGSTACNRKHFVPSSTASSSASSPSASSTACSGSGRSLLRQRQRADPPSCSTASLGNSPVSECLRSPSGRTAPRSDARELGQRGFERGLQVRHAVNQPDQVIVLQQTHDGVSGFGSLNSCHRFDPRQLCIFARIVCVRPQVFPGASTEHRFRSGASAGHLLARSRLSCEEPQLPLHLALELARQQREQLLDAIALTRLLCRLGLQEVKVNTFYLRIEI